MVDVKPCQYAISNRQLWQQAGNHQLGIRQENTSLARGKHKQNNIGCCWNFFDCSPSHNVCIRLGAYIYAPTDLEQCMDQHNHAAVDFSLGLHSLDLPCFLALLCARRLAQLRQLIALTHNGADRAQSPCPQRCLLCSAFGDQGEREGRLGFKVREEVLLRPENCWRQAQGVC